MLHWLTCHLLRIKDELSRWEALIDKGPCMMYTLVGRQPLCQRPHSQDSGQSACSQWERDVCMDTPFLAGFIFSLG
jgi:hypothetical protein